MSLGCIRSLEVEVGQKEFRMLPSPSQLHSPDSFVFRHQTLMLIKERAGYQPDTQFIQYCAVDVHMYAVKLESSVDRQRASPTEAHVLSWGRMTTNRESRDSFRV